MELTLNVQITKEVIAISKKRSPSNCVIANAIKRALALRGLSSTVLVSRFNVDIAGTVIFLPRNIINLITQYDVNNYFPETEFLLHVPHTPETFPKYPRYSTCVINGLIYASLEPEMQQKPYFSYENETPLHLVTG